MATGQDQQKNPALVAEGGVRNLSKGRSRHSFTPHPVRSFSACAWKSALTAFAALRVVPGAPMRTERKLRRAAAEYRANLIVRDIITELVLL